MTSLLDLPDDIFLEIFSYFAFSKRDLIRISTLSRRLSILSRGQIYRHVHLPVVLVPATHLERRRKPGRGNPRTGNSEPDHRPFSLFFRSISSNPSLAPLVRSLHLEWKPYSAGDEYAVINALLRRLSNVTHLKFSADDHPGNGYGSFNPVFLDVNLMRRLRTIELDVFFLSSTALAQLMLVPTVESIIATRFRDAAKPALQPGSTLADFTALPLAFPTRLRHLNLGIFRIPLPVLHSILKHAPHLRRLAATLPGRGNPTDVRAPLDARRLRPAAVARALDPVRHALQELSLVNDRHEWAGSDGTRADFSAFRQLRKMRVAPGLWFSWGAYAHAVSHKVDQGFCWCKEAREGVWKMLPRSLEELEVWARISLLCRLCIPFSRIPMPFLAILVSSFPSDIYVHFFFGGSSTGECASR